ncbi:MAG: efflux RND transporter periplasmic adaptor subunit [Eubacteriales bacterium]|nr:efflux RND transporter periplasmic adaptor subunit [Eubacteriales bacterium]
MKKLGKKLWLCILAAVLALLFALFFLKKQNDGNMQGGGPGQGMGQAPGGEQQAKADVVSVVTPETGNIYITTGLTGTLESSDVVYVYAKAAGDVTDVKVKAGDTVTAGQVLFEIDTEQVESAKNSLDAAAVSLTQAQSSLNRMKILYDGGDLSEQEYEQYVNSLESAKLQYNSAKLTYDRQVEYSTVTAPISGRIESCDTEVYDRVTANGQLCVISGEGNKKITFYVTQRMLENLSEGDALTVEKNGKSYEAHISAINSMVDSATGLFKIEAQLEDTDEVATGTVVKLELVTNKTENAMVIPIDAVYYSGGDAFVYLYQGGTAKTAAIEVGLTDDTYAEVLSGLSFEDQVIKSWSSNLYEGAKIRLSGEREENGEQVSEASEASGAPEAPEAPEAGETAGLEG